jgi:hypothetical protein
VNLLIGLGAVEVILHTLLYKLNLYPKLAFRPKNFPAVGFKCIVKEVVNYIESVTCAVADWSRVRQLTLAVFPHEDAAMEVAVEVDLGAFHLLDDSKLQDLVDAIFRTPFPESDSVGDSETRTWRLLVETRGEGEEVPVEMLAEVDVATKSCFESMPPLVTPVASVHSGDRLVITCNFMSFPNFISE